MKKAFCLILALVVTALCACSAVPGQAELLAKVEGTWTMRYAEDPEDVKDFLAAYDFYEEEIALVTTQLWSVMTVTFKSDYTFAWSEPTEELKACVREFFIGVFDELYAGRENLSEIYETDMSLLSKEEFLQFYADMYTVENFDALVDGLVEDAYDYDGLVNYWTGTFTINSLQITVDGEGTDNDGYINYKIEGDTLTLNYSDSTEVYTKVN